MQCVGTVTAFDEGRGLGILTGDTDTGEQGAVLPFHCTALADGSRTVDVGARAVCTVVPGHLGRYEAHDIVVVATAARAGAPSY